MGPVEFAAAAMAYCSATNGSVSSWGRTPKRNAAVGGVPDSAHQLWLAVDVVYDDPVPEEKAKRLAARLGLVLLREDDHDHVQGG